MSAFSQKAVRGVEGLPEVLAPGPRTENLGGEALRLRERYA